MSTATHASPVHVIPIDPVKSEALAGYGYDPDQQTAAVQFGTGHILHYHAVPDRIWEEWQAVPSKGGYYAREIKGRFRSEKVTGTCGQCGDIGYIGKTCDDCGTAPYAVKVL